MHSVSEYDQRSAGAFASLRLTPREAEVLFWISQGKSNHDIGVILGAKTATIRKHVEHIFAKLNVENRTAAAVTALETCRSVAPRAKSNGSQPWVAIGGRDRDGAPTPVFRCLGNLRRGVGSGRVMQPSCLKDD
jgi:DNA-binding CsgD family transcriptional regulator